MVSNGPPWTLSQLAGRGDVDGDGIVAACCTFPAGPTRTHKLIWADAGEKLAGHSTLLRHPKTHEYLKGLLS